SPRGAPRSPVNIILVGHLWNRPTMRLPCAEPARTSRANPSDRCRSLSPGIPSLDAQTFVYPIRSSDDKSARLANTFGPQRRMPAHENPYMTAATVSGRRRRRRDESAAQVTLVHYCVSPLTG